jgi:rhodanese-related sulfurtransferase
VFSRSEAANNIDFFKNLGAAVISVNDIGVGSPFTGNYPEDSLCVINTADDNETFTSDDAKKIISFFLSHHEKQTKSLIVHCTMGVSRSGAIAAFLNDLLNNDWETFKRQNPRIIPNSHITTTLRKTYYDN